MSKQQAASSKQRRSEWLEGADWELFERQYRKPYRITLAFFSWLTDKGVLISDQRRQILYIGAGMGANLLHVSRCCPGNTYTGIDLNAECVRRGNKKLISLNAQGCALVAGDLFDLPENFRDAFDGVFSLATLSWLPDFEAAAGCFTTLRPNWIAATSLFYDGPVDVTIQTSDYTRPIGGQPSIKKFYNVYSLPRVRDFFASRGYQDFSSRPFDIDIDLPKPSHGGMGTYTERLADGRRLQISGPVLMSWYFILARKS